MDIAPDRADPLPVYVLIGGSSRRFRVDKASYEVDKEPWALHVARRLAQADELVVLVGDRPAGAAFADAKVAPDAPGASGPMGGLLAALADRESRWGPGWLCLASCDLVRPERAWLEPLLYACLSSRVDDGAAYRDARGWQPFPSVLHTRALRGLEELACKGVTSLQEAFGALRIADRRWCGPGDGPPQANTREALTELLGPS